MQSLPIQDEPVRDRKLPTALYADEGGAIGTRLSRRITLTAVSAGPWTAVSFPRTHVIKVTRYWIAVTNDVIGATTYYVEGLLESKLRA